MVRMGASAPLLLLGLRRPLRVGADGVQRGPEMPTLSFSGRGRRRANERTHAATHERPAGATRRTVTRQRRYGTPTTQRRPTTFDTANFSWGLCPQTPTFSRFALGFEHRGALPPALPTFFPEFYVEKHPPARPESTPRSPKSTDETWRIFAIFYPKISSGLFPKKIFENDFFPVT